MLNLARVQYKRLGIPWIELLLAVSLYATVLVYQGYQYGMGDQSQILPCLYAQDHPGFYKADHYVTSYLHSEVNERTIFHFLFRYLGYQQPWIVWLWHALLGITLMWAWLRIAGLGIVQPAYQYLAVASIFIIGFHTSVGSNELYYNMVIPSLAAKAICSWGLYYWLREKYAWWAALLAMGGLLQPLVGIQLFLITCCALGIQLRLSNKWREMPWRPISIYLLITLPWLILLAMHNGAASDPRAFMDIMQFRLSHHFFPSAFGWKHLVLFGVFAVLTLRFYKQRLKWFIILILLGCLLYTIAVEHYRWPQALYTQWWKTTIWLEALAFIALFVTLDKAAPAPRWIPKFKMVIPMLLLLLVGCYRLTGWFGPMPTYLLPWTQTRNDEVDISLQAEKLTPQDAVFIVPVEFTAFRWYSKRNLYVDYKALFHQEQFLKDWYKRMENIYAYGLKEKEAGFDLQVFSTTLLEEPSLISRDYWKSLGIGYIISPSSDVKNLQKLGSNATYSIYKL